jgi:hypothetical protein
MAVTAARKQNSGREEREQRRCVSCCEGGERVFSLAIQVVSAIRMGSAHGRSETAVAAVSAETGGVGGFGPVHWGGCAREENG